MEGGTVGQVLHGSATTKGAIRRAIQHSQESLRALAQRYGINQKTVAKWKKRASVADLPTGPKKPKSTVLSVEEEAIIVAFRRRTLLPLDDCLYTLQPTIPHLSRSSLHRIVSAAVVLKKSFEANERANIACIMIVNAFLALAFLMCGMWGPSAAGEASNSSCTLAAASKAPSGPGATIKVSRV
jgi:transposase-like protein